MVDKHGIHPIDENNDAPGQTNVKELKAYLGLLNYYCSFLQNLSTALHPLHDLLKMEDSSGRNSAQVEKEALSLIFGVRKFHKYLFGLDNTELPICNTAIARATKADPLLVRVFEPTLNGWPSQVNVPELHPFFKRRSSLSMEKGIIHWGIRLVIHMALRKRIMEELHEEHLGICRMKALARRYLWWPNLDIGIGETVQACPSCISVRNSPQSGTLHPWIWATRPFQRIHIDYAEYKGPSPFIFNDSYSKWLEVIPVR
nr:uncharacterized protein LOC117690946 [Crassostrea gigas]